MLNKNNERELAYVVVIDDITPIKGYDRVELAHVGGWTVVVGKGEFKTGDPAIYFEIDSQLPEVKPFIDMEFLAKKHYKIKTQKMCKSISQGLLMSAQNFGWDIGCDWNNTRPFILDDSDNRHYSDDESRFLTKQLGVTYAIPEDNSRKSNKPVNKYDEMAKRHGKLFSKMPFRWLMKREWGRKLLFMFFGKKMDSRGFPSWVVKTDEERCLIPQTKILTDKGKISIGKIVNNKMDVKVASVNADGSISYKRILDYQKFDNNYQDVITIGYPYSVGVNGRKNHLCCTPDHKLLTQRGYIEAKNLSTEDHLFMPSNCFGDDCLGALYGMIIGDGHIYNDKRNDGNLRFVATNGEDQIDYLKYKMSLFDNDGKIIDAGSSPYSGKRIYHWFISADGNITNKMRDEIYIDGKKTVTRKVINRLNDVGLALWYMDDGCLTYRNNEKQNPFIRLNTQALSKEENDLLCEFLSSKYRIKCNVCEDNKKDGRTYYYIRISSSSTEDFLEIVTPYMCKSMAYKTIPSLENMIGTKSVLYKKEQRVIEIPINSIQYGQHKNITIPKKFPYVYDIEVEDNHNFIADGVVVHNCQNMPWIVNDKQPFVATEKVDGCLDANVSVVTDEGCVPISKIVNSRMDVNVLTYNESLGRCEYKPIKEYHKWERVSDMYDIVVSQQGYKCGNRSKHIVCTSEHSFYTGNGKYIKAKDLMESDTIYHRYMTIDSYSKEILLGILLGDGSLSSKYGIVNGGVDFSHSVNQQDYFYEIVRLLGDGNTTVRNTISGYGSKMLSAHYKTNVEFKSFVEKHCWVNNKKTITKEWADELTPISLAFWYMDDGSITNADSNKARPRIQIATNNFTYDECKILSDMLLNKFNISTEIRTKDAYKGNILYFNTNNTDKFAALIAPYVFDSMKYKLPEYLRCIDYCLSNYTSTNGSSIVPTKILSIEKLQDYKRKYVFDLTIEDNHNYFANGVLTHNTSTTFTLKRGKGLFGKDEFYVCSRNVCFDKAGAKCFYDKNVYTEMAEKYDIENKMKMLLNEVFADCDWITIQGETYGSGIQKRDYSISTHRFMAFNFVTSKDGRWSTHSMKNLLEANDIPCVPIVDDKYILPDTIEELLKYADGKSVVDGGMREGIVFRSLDGKKSFKAVSNDYLLKFHQ